MRIVIAGGSGFLGTQVARRWSEAGHEVVILTRNVNKAMAVQQVQWDGKTVGAWSEILATADPVAVVNLAGKLVDCRPTANNIAALSLDPPRP